MVGGTPHNGQYGQASPKRGTFFRRQLYEMVLMSMVEVYESEATQNIPDRSRYKFGGKLALFMQFSMGKAQ